MAITPPLPGYRWHRFARIWQMPVLGEVFTAPPEFGSAYADALLARLARAARTAYGPP